MIVQVVQQFALSSWRKLSRAQLSHLFAVAQTLPAFGTPDAQRQTQRGGCVRLRSVRVETNGYIRLRRKLMKRMFWLLALALALPVTALGSSVDFTNSG